MTSEQKFPQGFLWGASTAAYQIEGAVGEGGRGRSIWDTFSHAPGHTLNGDTGDIACRHYSRLDEDLGLIGRLGLSAYRFSVAWPRVQPDGKGRANQAGLDFYRRLVAGLRQRGIIPVATLYHWDLPEALEDAGGWPERDTAERFGDYAAIVAEALSGDVAMWVTVNEPWCAAWLGYGNGEHAPGHADAGLARRATHHLLLGHARATAALRQTSAAPVGISLNLSPMVPASAHPLDVEAAGKPDGSQNRLYLDPLLKGRYPEDIAAYLPAHRELLDAVGPGDMDAIGAPLDFLGVNYYMAHVVASTARRREAGEAGYWVPPVPADEPADGAGAPGYVIVRRPDRELTAMGWEVDAGGLTDLLVRLRDDYGPMPVYITENGTAVPDYAGPDGAVRDPGRIRYLEQHLRAARDAIDRGVDLRGYMLWSLMDNFEWSYGYAMRFGLVWVDYPTGQRSPKDSYRWYQQVIAANGLPSGD
ncbi:MAG: family 1 glycosylhydrolase [Acidimicrobiales bacterium]